MFTLEFIIWCVGIWAVVVITNAIVDRLER